MAAFGLVAGSLLAANTVLAVHDTGVFELDGNAATTTSHDWDQVCYQVTHDSRCGTTTGAAAVAASWTSDILEGTTDPFVNNPNATIFTGGGSKDPIDINQWAWKDGAGGLPDKDNLVHSFAARYSLAPNATTCPSGGAATCELLFFGSDRFDNSGDAQQGFWFFQNPIGLGTTPLGGGTSFTGVHKAGDLLIISDFSNGGTTSTISIYVWDPTVSGNLRLLQTSSAANCATAAAHDAFCGIVNPGPALTTAPWPFTDKSGNHSYLNGEFYEGGVNLSTLGLSAECFASVASETRSSTSTTATLKDFVLGGFGKCDTTFSTTPSVSTASIGAGASVSVTDSASLMVSGTPSWHGTLDFYLCGPSATTCSTSGTHIGTTLNVDQTTSQPISSAAATVTSVGTYCWAGVFTSQTNGVPSKTDASSGECFTITALQPSLPTQASASVLIGNAISDTANLSGTANKPGSPVINPTTAGGPAGGTITFNLYGPNDATCSGAVIYTATANVSGDGSYSSGSFTPTSAGTYRWVASYSGDSPNTLGFTGACNGTNESVVVNPKQPTITTDATADPPTGLPLGSAISDQATLSGAAAGAGGTITFNLYGPDDATCSGAVIFTSTATVSGNGTYNSGSFTPTAIGTYRWIASYSGDAPNTLPVSGLCNDTNEASLLFSLTPSVSTSQFFYPNDSATITVSNADGPLAGSVHFQAWTNAQCSGTPVVDQTITDVTAGTGGSFSRTVETSNTTHRVAGNVSLYWQIDYTSTNPAQNSVPGTCGMENSTISVTDLP